MDAADEFLSIRFGIMEINYCPFRQMPRQDADSGLLLQFPDSCGFCRFSAFNAAAIAVPAALADLLGFLRQQHLAISDQKTKNSV